MFKYFIEQWYLSFLLFKEFVLPDTKRMKSKLLDDCAMKDSCGENGVHRRQKNRMKMDINEHAIKNIKQSHNVKC